MISENVADDLIHLALQNGADFAELFIEETAQRNLSYKDQKLEAASGGTDFGVGIRLIKKGEVRYAHASTLSDSVLKRMVVQLAAGFDKSNIVSFEGFKDLQTWQSIDVKRTHASVSDSERLDMLQKVDQLVRTHDEIQQVSVSTLEKDSKIFLFNSEGLRYADSRTRSRFMLNVTAGNSEDKVSVSESPGALGGYEFFDSLNLEDIANSTRERARRVLHAAPVKGGTMPVIMGNGFGGVIFHEACGHPLETESVRKKASPFTDKLGKEIGQSCLTAIDDGTLGGLWGSLPVDDEGTPTKKTTLIENGILKNFMSDRVGAKQVGVALTGSCRRESYKYAPVSRMRNTYIAAGLSSMNDLIGSVEDGLYAVRMGGGSVNPATGEFNFSVEEGFMIRGGKKAEIVRGATLIGKGHEILPQISMVGQDLEFAAGMCGASSGAVPVTVGQPSLKVDSILVGGL